mmetsp:Transcript_108679/g.272351  ORF Transcript_108679/g.272351 Transcript_108679/m.272351 type:complete len:120 (+) Transcript_108679:893-1252(+)
MAAERWRRVLGRVVRAEGQWAQEEPSAGEDGKELSKFVEGPKQLTKLDPLVVGTIEKSGEHVIAGCGEMYVEICSKDLRDEYAQRDFIVLNSMVICNSLRKPTCSLAWLVKRRCSLYEG